MPTYRRSLAQSLQSRPSTPSRQSLGQSLGLGSATVNYQPPSQQQLNQPQPSRRPVQTGIRLNRRQLMRSPGGMAQAQWQPVPEQVVGPPQAPSGSAVPSRLAPGAVPYALSRSLGLGMTGNEAPTVQTSAAVDANGNPQLPQPYDAGPGPTHAPGTIGNPSRALVSFLHPGLRPKVPSQEELFVGPQQPAPRDAMEELKAKFGGFNPKYLEAQRQRAAHRPTLGGTHGFDLPPQFEHPYDRTINANEGGTPTGIRTVANNTGQQRAFQPKAGTLSGGSTVTVNDSGHATVQGHIDPRRLNALGIREIPQYQQVGDYGRRRIGTEMDRSEATARQAFNRKRQENKLLAKRLGIDLDTGDPATQGLGTEDYASGLRAMSNDRADLNRQLQDRRIAQGAAQGNPFLAALQGQRQQPAEQAPAAPSGPDDAARWRNQYNQDYGSLLAARPEMDPAEADRIARERANRMNPAGAPDGFDVPSGSPSQPPVRSYPNTAQGANSAEADLKRKYPQFHEVLKPLSEEDVEDWLEREFPDGAPLDLKTQALAWKRGGQTQRARRESRDRHQREADNQERSFNQMGLPGLWSPPRAPDGTGRTDIRFRGA